VGWYHLFQNGRVEWNTVYLSTSIILICVIFIAHTYETVFLVKESETEKIKSEKLLRAKTEAELKALNSHIDPHFLFNSLNTLSYLIEETPAKALEFNDNLADVYRYILRNRSTELITLDDELEFTGKYFSLLEKRFGNAVRLNVEHQHDIAGFLIPPISLQSLIENAVKHNSFSTQNPLVILIVCTEKYVSVKNNRRPRNDVRVSEKTGLNNLRERCRLILGKRNCGSGKRRCF
jgi:LytS/YehU family sensor histidine kinase